MELTSSLLILAPPEVQAFAAPLRQRYASDSYMQGPAHITLFFPFVPTAEIPTATAKLRRLCEKIHPFRITMDHYDRFETAHFFAPADSGPILTLHQHLLEAFPDYPPYEGEHGRTLVPHLTLAHVETKVEADQIELPAPPTFTFPVDNLYLYIGPEEGNIPWIPSSIIPLGGFA